MVEIEHVAAAPAPPPPEIEIVGASVYPAPAFVISILKIEVILALSVVIATPDALCPPSGASEKVIVGADVNPYPSLFKNISATQPLDTPTVAVAV